ncbi:DNA repair helicase Rad3 [Chloropicon primus]|uniref:DNA 5'-3' helicase n=1 Tax=Chloropicon primus TaxID=1764295 RepID=A0A5B8N0S6_9CHLO|nr:DNA repair helicase Rad3 [Chloropicon primus]UPR04607.1 DNA repair helicase Rad3 [Chloropicon primus]|mmetsp:Transcript_3253/g.9048  ORF Transcript_3253/g.9048 Transcript_3253/m.9048 type:complete len:751 (+) Transcript_3253:468-2720(+)|eukprot:QDZ25410.1 DNA repair helicase Rad3 [Chloropicon primus]
MKFQLEDLTVYFPYDRMYPEQYRYMLELKHSLDAKGHCLLEMPTGTGKTVTLLSLITSYQLQHPEVGKLVYCTRTVPEMEKVLEELQNLISFRERELGVKAPILALGLSSRKNMCIHQSVREEVSRESVDAKCRKLTASWVREKAVDKPSDYELCSFYEQYEAKGAEAILPPGVYTLDDLKVFGQQKGWCPYFLARHMISYANVIVYNYQYMLDPKVSSLVSRELERECVVVFDEAHNIDNVCIEALSVNLRQQTLDNATRSIARLKNKIEEAKATDAQRLSDEYNRLVRGLAQQGAIPQGGEEWLSNPALPQDILQEAVPGNIRRAEHFMAFLRRFVEHLKERLGAQQFQSENPTSFLDKLRNSSQIDSKSLKFCYDRLQSLMKTLEIIDTDDYYGLQLVADFGTLVGTYDRGFAIIIEPYDERLPSVPDPVIQLSCLDSSLAVRPVFDKFQSVVITSGTLSPIDLYPKILNFHPVVIQSLNMTLVRDCICPVILTKGADQMPVSSAFEMRDDPGVVRNYGKLLVDLSAVVPDGIVCFFVSYLYMDKIVSQWSDMGILRDIMQNKLVFIETQDVVETTLALDNYRRACDCGRGAVFFSVARGKVAEGIDFDRHYGRCVVMFGVPYQYTLSRILRARLEYLRETHGVSESDFLAFDAVRQAAQCVGRVIRSKADYGLMVLADRRYARADKRDKLPAWISQRIKEAHMHLDESMLLAVARQFMRSMAQPFDGATNSQMLLTEERLNSMMQT